MYIIKKPDRRRKEKRKIQDINVIGFLMPTRNKKIKIKDSVVTNIVIIDKKLANPLVVKKVSKLYKKLIAILTELLVSDEESGDVYREVLNQLNHPYLYLLPQLIHKLFLSLLKVLLLVVN